MLAEVTFTVERGAFFGIVGPNGSGKTTLLRAALGILAPRAGRVLRPAQHGQARIGYVPQRLAIDPIFPLTVRDIVLMGRYRPFGALRGTRAADSRAAAAACERLGILDLLESPYRDLSGGQQQRTLIARALAAEPEVLVFDEPTNGMDLPAEQSIMDLILGLRRERGSTVLFVTHLLNLVADAATELALVRDGRVRVGRREDVLRPEILAALYGVPVEVHRVAGRTFVIASGGAP